MFVRCLLLALMISTMALPVLADNTLVPPEKARLLVLDGKNAEKIDAQSGIRLDNGRHQLVFQIKTLVRDAGDSKMYTSTPYIMTFNLEGSQKYTIQTPKFNTSRDTDKLERAPEQQFTLVNQRGETKPFEFKTLNKSGLMIGADTLEDIQKFNLSDHPAAIRELAGTVYMTAPGSYYPAQQPAPAAVQPAPATAQPMSENMLQYWYKQADEATRERFMKWVAESKKQAK